MARAPTFIKQQSRLEADEDDLVDELLFAIANNETTDSRRRHQLEQGLVPLSEALAWFEPDPVKRKELPARLTWPLTHNWLTLYGTPKGQSKSRAIPIAYYDQPFAFDEERNEVQPRSPVSGRSVYRGVTVRRKRLEQAKHNDIYEQVKHFKITPAEGELEAARCGFKPLNPPPDPASLDPLTDSRWSDWTPAMTMAWILWRDVDKVRRQCKEWRTQLRFWAPLKTPGHEGETLHLVDWTPRHAREHGSCSEIEWEVREEVKRGLNPRVPVSKAKDEMWHALKTGQVKASGFQNGKRGTIDPVAFADLDICEPPQRGKAEYLVVTEGPTDPAYAKPLFSRADILRMWPPLEATSAAQTMSPAHSTRIGVTAAAADVNTLPVLDGAHLTVGDDTAKLDGKIDRALKELAAAGVSIEMLRPGERRRRLSDQMKTWGLTDAEIPKERAFRKHFNGR